jgi:putative addiction module component (TIGR02574 family)
MPKTLAEVTRYAKQLPPRQRLKLACDLLDLADDEEKSESPAEIEKSWADEINARMEEVRSGKVKMIPWEDVKLGLQKRLKK